MKGKGNALGYIIGTVIVVPIVLYLLNLIFFTPRKVTENQIDNYIENSIETKDNVGKYPPYVPGNLGKEKLGLNSKSVTRVLDRHSQYLVYHGYSYYSKKHKKFFNLIVINWGGGIYNGLDEEEDIFIYVNKEDLNNPEYGTIDNPVPILHFIGVNKSIRPDNKDFNKIYMSNIYRENVKLYLTYFMSKKEFKARYGE